MPSHALPSGAEARARWRARRRKGLRQLLRDSTTWGVIGACAAGSSLSERIVSQLWPRAHGAGYFVTHVVVVAGLGGAIAFLLVAVCILSGLGRDRSR